MMLKDLLYAARDIAYALRSPNGTQGFYWDDAPAQELSALIDHLSNTGDDERFMIRQLLRQHRTTSLLDVGCGPATELSGYKKHDIHLRYTGIDRSKTMLTEACRRHPGTSFIYGEIQQLPFQDASFDTVLLKHVLEHLPRYEDAVSEALRVSQRLVIVDFFHHLQMPFDVRVKNRNYWNNWYSRRGFERFIHKRTSGFERMDAISTSAQHAEIYVLHK